MRAARRGHRARRSRGAVEPEPRGVGARAVRDGEAGGDPRERQPGVPNARARVRAAPLGLPDARGGVEVQDQRLRGDGRRGPRRHRRAGARRVPRRSVMGRAALGGGARRRGRRARALRRARPLRPDQHPVHERHDRLPQGRDALAPQHPQQRLLRRRGLPDHARGPHLRAGPVLPLLRHGHGQPGGFQSRRVRRASRRGVRAAVGARGGAGGGLHGRSTGCRRCSSPSSTTRSSSRST